MGDGISFQREPVHEVWDEALPIMREHYEEVAKYKDIPLDPNFEAYRHAEENGFFAAFTVRENEVLVGYNSFLIGPSLHYKGSVQASQDVIYLDPKFRGRMLGLRFMNWCDGVLATMGVQVVYQHVKITREELNYGPMLGRIGYEPMDTIWARRLDKTGGGKWRRR